jgi:hypothetical protein
MFNDGVPYFVTQQVKVTYGVLARSGHGQGATGKETYGKNSHTGRLIEKLD